MVIRFCTISIGHPSLFSYQGIYNIKYGISLRTCQFTQNKRTNLGALAQWQIAQISKRERRYLGGDWRKPVSYNVQTKIQSTARTFLFCLRSSSVSSHGYRKHVFVRFLGLEVVFYLAEEIEW